MASRWTCPKCKTVHPRTKQVCGTDLTPLLVCDGRRPKKRKPEHQLVLDLMPYDEWVERFGVVIDGVLVARCNICGRPPVNRALHRDHDHRSGNPRGLLCHRCNRALPDWMTVKWLEKAIEYLTQGNGPEGPHDGH